MARLFDDGSSQYLQVISTPVTVAPFTASLWVKPDATGITHGLIYIGESASSSNYWVTLINTNDTVSFIARNTTARFATSGNTVTTNEWNHVLSECVSSTNRTIVVNGGTPVQNTLSATPTTNSLGIGAQTRSTPNNFASGAIAEVGIWDVALDDEEKAALASGMSPRLIRPASLVFYAPLYNEEDADFVGGLSLTPTASPTTAAHYPIISPIGPIIGNPTAAASTALPLINAYYG